MKRNGFFVYFILILMLVVTVTACGKGEKREYYFSGENEDISLRNGVAVIDTEKDTLSGGELVLKTDKFKNIKYYNVKLYIKTEDYSLISNAEEVINGSFSKNDLEGDIGSISPFMDNNTTLDEFKNNLYFKLETVNINGEKAEYIIHLKVHEVIDN